MDRDIRSQLRDVKRMLGEPVRKKRRGVEAEAEANRLVSQYVDRALNFDDDQWHEMVRSFVANSDNVVRLITADILIERLTSSDELVCARATIWLAAIGRQAIASLGLILLRNHSLKMGVAVAQALGQIACQIPERERMFLILKLEIGASRTRHHEVRCACVEAIFQIRKLNAAASG